MLLTVVGRVVTVLRGLLAIAPGVLTIDHGLMAVVAVAAVDVVPLQLRLDRLTHIPVGSRGVALVRGSIALVGDVVSRIRVPRDSLVC